MLGILSKRKVPVLLVVFILVCLPLRVSATAGQWSNDGGNNIFYNDGNIGIGTSSPSAKLTAVGNDTLKNHTLLKLGTVDSRYWQMITTKFAHPLYGDYGLVISQPISAYSGGCANSCPGDLVLQPGRNTIINVGNVGIGTNTPGNYKLAVNGSIRAKSVYIDNNWADYVFEDDYELMPLDELERYIEENNHLPNVPSAEKIESSGISVGEISKIQMEKIEELSLYILQLEERIARLESK